MGTGFPLGMTEMIWNEMAGRQHDTGSGRKAPDCTLENGSNVTCILCDLDDDDHPRFLNT